MRITGLIVCLTALAALGPDPARAQQSFATASDAQTYITQQLRACAGGAEPRAAGRNTSYSGRSSVNCARALQRVLGALRSQGAVSVDGILGCGFQGAMRVVLGDTYTELRSRDELTDVCARNDMRLYFEEPCPNNGVPPIGMVSCFNAVAQEYASQTYPSATPPAEVDRLPGCDEVDGFRNENCTTDLAKTVFRTLTRIDELVGENRQIASTKVGDWRSRYVDRSGAPIASAIARTDRFQRDTVALIQDLVGFESGFDSPSGAQPSRCEALRTVSPAAWGAYLAQGSQAMSLSPACLSLLFSQYQVEAGSTLFESTLPVCQRPNSLQRDTCALIAAEAVAVRLDYIDDLASGRPIRAGEIASWRDRYMRGERVRPDAVEKALPQPFPAETIALLKALNAVDADYERLTEREQLHCSPLARNAGQFKTFVAGLPVDTDLSARCVTLLFEKYTIERSSDLFEGDADLTGYEVKPWKDPNAQNESRGNWMEEMTGSLSQGIATGNPYMISLLVLAFALIGGTVLFFLLGTSTRRAGQTPLNGGHTGPIAGRGPSPEQQGRRLDTFEPDYDEPSTDPEEGTIAGFESEPEDPRYQSLVAQIEKLRLERDTATNELRKVKGELETAKAQTVRLQSQNDDLIEENTTLKAGVDTAQPDPAAETVELRAAKEAAESNAERLQSQLSKAETEIDSLKAVHSAIQDGDASQAMEALEVKLAEQAEQLSSLREDNQKLTVRNEELEAIREQAESLGADKTAFDKDHSDLEQALEEEKANVLSRDERIAEVEMARDNMRRTNVALLTAVGTGLAGLLTQIRNRLGADDTGTADRERAITEARALPHTLIDDMDSGDEGKVTASLESVLKSAREGLEAREAALAAELEKAQTNSANAVKQAQAAQKVAEDEVVTLKTTVSDLEAKVAERDGAVATAQSAAQEASQRVETLSAELLITKVELKQTQAERDRLETELDQLRKEADRAFDRMPPELRTKGPLGSVMARGEQRAKAHADVVDTMFRFLKSLSEMEGSAERPDDLQVHAFLETLGTNLFAMLTGVGYEPAEKVKVATDFAEVANGLTRALNIKVVVPRIGQAIDTTSMDGGKSGVVKDVRSWGVRTRSTFVRKAKVV